MGNKLVATNYGGTGEQLTPIEFTLQHTDYKLVGAYRKFTGDNACNPNLVRRIDPHLPWG